MNEQIYEEATHWLIKHRESELSARDKQLFDSWLRESPQHVRAYLEMSSVWEGVPELDPNWNPTAEELIERVRGESNIHPLQATAGSTGRRNEKQATVVSPPASSERRPRWAALVATILLAIGVGTTSYWLSRDTYSTGTGEQRSLVLEDGSTIELNAKSKVRVRFTEQRRGIELVEGQALFRVAHDTARPFIVRAGNTDVRAVGTQFDVYRKRDGTVVTVIEGRVSSTLHEGAAVEGSKPTLIAAGEQLVISAATSPTKAIPLAAENPRRTDVEAATAWTQRRLVFDSSPLSEVAEEFNRYNARQLVITDAALGDLRISGIFSSVEPALLLKFLRAQPELEIEETAGEIRVGKK